MRYYSCYRIAKNVTAYSMLLSESAYVDFRESRINSYAKEFGNSQACSLVYVLQGDEYRYIDGSEWYDQKLDYVDNVLHHPEAGQQYYFGVIIRQNKADGETYAGIIANDSVHEVIEFSADLPEDYGEHEEPEQNWGDEILSGLFLLALVVLSIQILYIVGKAMYESLKRKWNGE